MGVICGCLRPVEEEEEDESEEDEEDESEEDEEAEIPRVELNRQEEKRCRFTLYEKLAAAQQIQQQIEVGNLSVQATC